MSFWESLLERAQEFGETVIEWAILLAVALFVLIIGRWIIGIVRNWIEKLLGARALDSVWQRSGIGKALEEGDQTAASIVATVAYAYLMVALFLIVARILNLVTIEGLLERLLGWIPLLLLAAVIIIIAAAAGSWAAGLVRPFAEEQNVPWLTDVVHLGVIIFGVLFAMDIINIDFAEDVVKIVIGAATIALAIAFGVGGIDTAKKWWAKYASPKGSAPESPPTDYQ